MRVSTVSEMSAQRRVQARVEALFTSKTLGTNMPASVGADESYSAAVVGTRDGVSDGDRDGTKLGVLEGASLGASEGGSVAEASLGARDGAEVDIRLSEGGTEGNVDGAMLGVLVDGDGVGACVGEPVELLEGPAVGLGVGADVGKIVGVVDSSGVRGLLGS